MNRTGLRWQLAAAALVLVCLPAVTLLRAGTSPRRIPPWLGAVVDQPVDTEIAGGAAPATMVPRPWVRPPRSASGGEVPHALLAVNQPQLRSRLTRISLPPPAGV